MSVRDGLIVSLPEEANGEPRWQRVVDGALVGEGVGATWLQACGLSRLPDDCVVMLVPPAGLTPLHFVSHPDMPARQGRAAARLAAIADSIGPEDALLAVADANEDPASPHVVAVVARADMQHWLLWAQHNGLDPDYVVPAGLLLPEPPGGEGDTWASGVVGCNGLLRGRMAVLPAGEPLTMAVVGEAPVVPVAGDTIADLMTAALSAPPLDLRTGDFARRRRRGSIDRRQLWRMAAWCGFIALASLLIALIAIVRYNLDAGRLDAETLALARTVVPGVDDPERAEAELDSRLAARGGGAYTFTGPVAGLFTAMQGTPSVSLTRLSRGADGLLSATLASARAEDINIVLLALQSAGFTITATSSRDTSGRVLAEITVQP